MSALRAVYGNLAKPSATCSRSFSRGISRALRASMAKGIGIQIGFKKAKRSFD